MHYKLLQSLSLLATNPATYDSIATVMAGDGAFFRASGSISITSMLQIGAYIGWLNAPEILISSVRSSYSHPDLLVIQQPHFFR